MPVSSVSSVPFQLKAHPPSVAFAIFGVSLPALSEASRKQPGGERVTETIRYRPLAIALEHCTVRDAAPRRHVSCAFGQGIRKGIFLGAIVGDRRGYGFWRLEPFLLPKQTASNHPIQDSCCFGAELGTKIAVVAVALEFFCEGQESDASPDAAIGASDGRLVIAVNPELADSLKAKGSFIFVLRTQ